MRPTPALPARFARHDTGARVVRRAAPAEGHRAGGPERTQRNTTAAAAHWAVVVPVAAQVWAAGTTR